MELGSEYNLSLTELNIVDDNIFNYLLDFENCHFFDSGRSALKHFISQFDHQTMVLLPEFICDSVTNCFDKSQIDYYKLKSDFTIDIDDLKTKIENKKVIIFLMHYFGSLQPSETLNQVKKLANISESIIIEDTTHSLLTCKQTIGDYMICSIRKWLPIPGGGVLYYNMNKALINEPDYPKSIDNNRTYGMILKDLFLNNRFNCNIEYRSIFTKSEEILDNQKNIYEISDFSRFIASCFEINKLKQIRKNNYNYLLKEMIKFGVIPAIKITKYDIPFVFPLYVNDRDELRKYLIENRIYCAVHWPFDNYRIEKRLFAKKNSLKLLSLPIDQRYDNIHIQYMVETLKKYGGDFLFST